MGDDDPEEPSGGRSRVCGGRGRGGRARDGKSAGAGRAGGARPRAGLHDRVRDLVTQQRGYSCRAVLPGGQSEGAAVSPGESASTLIVASTGFLMPKSAS